MAILFYKGFVKQSEQFEDNNLAVSPIKEYDEESELDDEIIDWGIADEDSADIEYEIPETLPAFIIYCLSLTVLPAFIEEIIFRGIVMQSLRRFGDIFALVASSLIFGIFHLNLIQMPYAFILGLCIGYFVMRTGSLWVAVIIHLVNNSVAVVFEVLSPQMSDEVWYISNLGYNLVCIILSVIAFIAILMKYKDMFRFEPSKSVLAPGKRTVYFLTSPALIVAMIAAVAMTLPYIYLL